MKQTEFQYYKGDITADRPEGFVTLGKMLHAIQEPKPKVKALLNHIKEAAAAGNETLKNELKKQLFPFTPCAIVSTWRKYENIQNFTGLAVLDFDKISFATKLKKYLFDTYPCVVATWISPSGKGVKAILKIPVVQSVDEFKQYFFGIAAELRGIDGFDPINQNPVQKLFIGYDPDVLIRYDAETWTIKGLKQTSFNVNRPPISIQSVQTNDGIKFWIKDWFTNKIIAINDNDPHHPQLRDNCLTLGGYVAAGYIEQYEAEVMAENGINQNHYMRPNFAGYYKTACWAIVHGMSSPLTWNEDVTKTKQVKEQPTTSILGPAQEIDEQLDPVKQSTSLTTIGDLFDYFKEQGYGSLIEAGCTGISANNWPSKKKMPYEN